MEKKDLKREITEWCQACESESTHFMTNEEIINARGKVKCSDCGGDLLLCGECKIRQCMKQPHCFEFNPLGEE